MSYFSVKVEIPTLSFELSTALEAKDPLEAAAIVEKQIEKIITESRPFIIIEDTGLFVSLLANNIDYVLSVKPLKIVEWNARPNPFMNNNFPNPQERYDPKHPAFIGGFTMDSNPSAMHGINKPIYPGYSLFNPNLNPNLADPNFGFTPPGKNKKPK